MNSNPRILIIEDEILIAEYVKELLFEENFIHIDMAHDVDEAIYKINSFLPELILMDINLNGKNAGIELAKLKNENARIIFLTGQYDHVLMSKALESNPDSYLTKPIRKNDLVAAIKLVLFKEKSNFITIKDGYDEVKINLENILFIKSEGNYIDIQLIGKKHTIRQSLESFYKEIPSNKFIRIHRSYIVNKDRISHKKSHTIVVDIYEIPISRNYTLDF